ncbi:MAG TPA: GYD domain-containing protein [Gemmataceae bacterium]|nr:GYD domain-containing protein [Gemmataceae bacterium]
MATYIMLTRLTDKGAETIKEHPGRNEAVAKELEGFGVKVVAQYAVLGSSTS